jgi:hypothetical protein
MNEATTTLTRAETQQVFFFKAHLNLNDDLGGGKQGQRSGIGRHQEKPQQG